MIRLHFLLLAGLSAAQWNPNYNRYMAYNAVGYNNGAYPQTDYSGYKGNPDPVPQSFYQPDPPRPEFDSNNGYDVIFTVAPPIPVAITNPHPSRISRGSTTPPPPPPSSSSSPSTSTSLPWWEIEDTTTTQFPWWLISPVTSPSTTRSTTERSTTHRPSTRGSTQWWTKKTEKPRPTPTWSTIQWWVATSPRPTPSTTKTTITESPTTTTTERTTTTTTTEWPVTVREVITHARSTTPSTLSSTPSFTPSSTRRTLPPASTIEWWKATTIRTSKKTMKRIDERREWTKREETTTRIIPSSTTSFPVITPSTTRQSTGFEWWNAATQRVTRLSTSPPFQWWTIPHSSTSHRMRAHTTSTISPCTSHERRTRPFTQSIPQWWRERTTEEIKSTTERITSHITNTNEQRTTRAPETTTIPEEYVNEEYDEVTTEVPSTTTEEPTTTPELIQFKTTQFKDLNKRAHLDFDGFNKQMTTTTELSTTIEEKSNEDEEEEREAEEMIIESIPVTTEVPLPSSPRPDSPLPHPPMLFHSHLEDEFPRPGWVKDHKENKTEVIVEVKEKKENEGDNEDVIDSSSEMKELYEEVDETLTSTQGNPSHSISFTSHSHTHSTADSFNGNSHSSNPFTHNRIAIPYESGLTPSSKHYWRSTVEPISHSNEESESELPSTTKHPLYSTRKLKKSLERSSMENEETAEIPSEGEMSEEWIIIDTRSTSEPSSTTESPPSTKWISSTRTSIIDRFPIDSSESTSIDGVTPLPSSTGRRIFHHRPSTSSIHHFTMIPPSHPWTIEEIPSSIQSTPFTRSSKEQRSESSIVPLSSSDNNSVNPLIPHEFSLHHRRVSTPHPLRMTTDWSAPLITDKPSSPNHSSFPTNSFGKNGFTAVPTYLPTHNHSHKIRPHSTQSPSNPSSNVMHTSSNPISPSTKNQFTVSSPIPSSIESTYSSQSQLITKPSHSLTALPSSSISTPSDEDSLLTVTVTPLISSTPPSTPLPSIPSEWSSSSSSIPHLTSHSTLTHFTLPSLATESPRVVKIHLPFKRHSPLPLDHLIHLFTTPSPTHSSSSPPPSSSSTPSPPSLPSSSPFPSSTTTIEIESASDITPLHQSVASTQSPISTTTEEPTTTTEQPVTVPIEVTKTIKHKKKTPKPVPLGNLNGNPLMFGVQKKTTTSTTTITESTITERTTTVPTTTLTVPVPSTTTSSPLPPSSSPSTTVVTSPPTTRAPLPQTTSSSPVTRGRISTTSEEEEIEVKDTTLPPRSSTSLPTTERTHHHSPRAITFAPQTDRPTTRTVPTTKLTTTTPDIDSFPTRIPTVIVPEASRFIVHSTTERNTHSPSTVSFTHPTTTTVPTTEWTTTEESSIDRTTTIPPIDPSSSPSPTLIPISPEDFDFELSATTTEQTRTREIEVELPLREEEKTPFAPPPDDFILPPEEKSTEFYVVDFDPIEFTTTQKEEEMTTNERVETTTESTTMMTTQPIPSVKTTQPPKSTTTETPIEPSHSEPKSTDPSANHLLIPYGPESTTKSTITTTTSSPIPLRSSTLKSVKDRRKKVPKRAALSHALFSPVPIRTTITRKRNETASTASTPIIHPPPSLYQHATIPRVRVSVDAANVVNEEGDKEGPAGLSMKIKKIIKPFASSTTARTITMKEEKKCCPCCAENLENTPSSTARPVRHSVSPTIVSATFAPIAHTNPPQYVVNFYEQQQIPLRQPSQSYIPQPPPPYYVPPPPPSPPCPCAVQQTKPCCELKPCCRSAVICPPPVPRPCCQPQQQLCCQPNLFEQMMAPARQLFGALGSLYAPPANNCGVCQGSAYRVARVKRSASGCSQCSGRRKRETTNEQHNRNKRTAGCISRAARAKRSANGNCADCSSINGIFRRQKRTADCSPCDVRGKREACPCAVSPSSYPISHLSKRSKREVNNKERGYETLLTCDSSCCDFSRCDQLRIFTSKKKVVV